MNETTKILLIVGGIAVAGFVVYKYAVGKSGSVSGQPTPGGTSTPSTNSGGEWWRNVGDWYNTGVNTWESLFGSNGTNG